MAPPAAAAAAKGQLYIAVIGIDRYREWPRLHNAVSDAGGARDAFGKLGFKHVGEPLLDDAATQAAMHHLVTDDLSRLGKDDSLVLFFAGHGHTETTVYSDGDASKRGYILPCDADPRRPGTWLRLQNWLSDVAHLPPKHILVILDACYSGIALDRAVIRWRDGGQPPGEPHMESLRARRSRRIITSALDDQRAMDGGPRPGHSLFTGYLIEAITEGLAAETRRPLATGSEIGLYVQRRVEAYAGRNQTPDFGELELHNRGELIVRLPGFEPKPRPLKPEAAKPGRRGHAGKTKKKTTTTKTKTTTTKTKTKTTKRNSPRPCEIASLGRIVTQRSVRASEKVRPWFAGVRLSSFCL